MLSRAFFSCEILKDGELPEDSSSSVRVSMSTGTMGSFPLLRAIGYGRCLVRLFQDRGYFQSRPATGHSHAASVHPAHVTPSSVLLVPLTFSPSPKASGGTDLLVTGSSYCLPLRLSRTN